jgi:hypothetical protein
VQSKIKLLNHATCTDMCRRHTGWMDTQTLGKQATAA